MGAGYFICMYRFQRLKYVKLISKLKVLYLFICDLYVLEHVFLLVLLFIPNKLTTMLKMSSYLAFLSYGSSLFQIQFHKLWFLIVKPNLFTFYVNIVGFLSITLFLVWGKHFLFIAVIVFLCVLLVQHNVLFSLFYLFCSELFCLSLFGSPPRP